MDKFLPKIINKVAAPPIKCQGIKTKLVKFIAESIAWKGKGKWIEPFLGSGVVLFNIQPKRAIIADSNNHIILFYKDIQSGRIDENIVEEYLREVGAKLLKQGESFYYEMREKFNKDGKPLDILFLNRSCFNGVMRFNSKGEFNVPFCHKPDRFRPAYITKIKNQVRWVRKVIENRDWQFEYCDWNETLSRAEKDDFVYMDPPYIGRHTDYYNNWPLKEAIKLSYAARKLPCGFALSMWKENKYRKNTHIDEYWSGLDIKTFSHFYHVGSTENLRNKMIEALIIKPGYSAMLKDIEKTELAEERLPLFQKR
jgi:DNA adenine methylase